MNKWDCFTVLGIWGLGFGICYLFPMMDGLFAIVLIAAMYYLSKWIIIEGSEEAKDEKN